MAKITTDDVKAKLVAWKSAADLTVDFNCAVETMRRHLRVLDKSGAVQKRQAEPTGRAGRPTFEYRTA